MNTVIGIAKSVVWVTAALFCALIVISVLIQLVVGGGS